MKLLIGVFNWLTLFPPWATLLICTSLIVIPHILLNTLLTKYLLKLQTPKLNLKTWILSCSILTFGLATGAVGLFTVVMAALPAEPFITRYITQLFPEALGSLAWIIALTFIPLLFSVLGLYLLLSRLTTLKTVSNSRIMVYSLLSTIAAFIISVVVIVGLVYVTEYCDSRASDAFHRLNAHLKAQCSHAQSETCPRDLSQLQAFDPPGFKIFDDCSYGHRYNFEPTTGVATFILRFRPNLVLISHPQHYPDAGGYSLYQDQWSQQLYPPAFPGPWEPVP